MEKLIFYTDKRNEWRQWLSENYKTREEVYFVFPTNDSADPALSYNDAVEEALCFGWIDGVAGTLDETHRLRRFTPRRKGSSYSQPNIERLIWLDKYDLISPDIRPLVQDIISKEFVFPDDIINELKKDDTVWENYHKFSKPYKRIRVAYIDAARKRPEEFKKRLDHFIEMTKKGKVIKGYGGIEKYYR